MLSWLQQSFSLYARASSVEIQTHTSSPCLSHHLQVLSPYKTTPVPPRSKRIPLYLEVAQNLIFGVSALSYSVPIQNRSCYKLPYS